MKRRWKPGDPERRKHPRELSAQMEALAQDVITLAAELRRIAATVRGQEVTGRGRG